MTVWMDTAKPGRKPRTSRRIILVLGVSAIVIASAFAVWVLFVRPRTLAEVYGFGRWSPGSAVAIEGTITSIVRENTSYGPEVYLGLDGGSECPNSPNVVGDPTATYAIGARFQTTLHFQALSVNGDPAVSAPELHCPFPSALEAIGTVLDAVSLVGGRILLAYNGTGPNGVVHYEILTANGRAYRPDTLPATLRKSVPIQGSNPALPAGGPIDSPARWRDFGALQFLRASGAYSEFPIVDDMPSLAAGVSRNGSLRFVDMMMLLCTSFVRGTPTKRARCVHVPPLLGFWATVISCMPQYAGSSDASGVTRMMDLIRVAGFYSRE